MLITYIIIINKLFICRKQLNECHVAVKVMMNEKYSKIYLSFSAILVI